MKTVLAAGLAVLALSSCATPSAVKEMQWVTDLPRGIWIIEAGTSAEAITCTPAFCQAGLNLSPYLLAVQYSKSPAGRTVRLSGRVEGCGRMVRKSLDLQGVERSLWQARFAQLFGEMIPGMRKACLVAPPKSPIPLNLGLLILEEER